MHPTLPLSASLSQCGSCHLHGLIRTSWGTEPYLPQGQGHALYAKPAEPHSPSAFPHLGPVPSPGTPRGTGSWGACDRLSGAQGCFTH